VAVAEAVEEAASKLSRSRKLETSGGVESYKGWFFVGLTRKMVFSNTDTNSEAIALRSFLHIL